MSFVLNNTPLGHTRSSANTPWECTSSPKFTLTKGYLLKGENTGGINGQLQFSGTELSHAIGMPGQNSNRLLPSKGTKPEVFTQGLSYFLNRSLLMTSLSFRVSFKLKLFNVMLLEDLIFPQGIGYDDPNITMMINNDGTLLSARISKIFLLGKTYKSV